MSRSPRVNTFDYGVKTTLPMVCRLETASYAFLTSDSGKAVFANSLTLPCAIKFRSSGTHSPICSGRSVGILKPKERLVLINQLLDLLGKESCRECFWIRRKQCVRQERSI